MLSKVGPPLRRLWHYPSCFHTAFARRSVAVVAAERLAGARRPRRRRPRAPLAPAALLRSRLAAAGSGKVRWALVTLSGITRPGESSNDIWSGIASVMGRAGANIQDAAGTFANQPMRASSGCEASEPLSSSSSDFVLGAFGTRIAPYADPYESQPGVRISVAMFFRAVLPEDNVPLMSSLMQQAFPLLVCTVTMGGALGEGLRKGAMLPGSSRADQVKRDRLTTLYFFGADYVGQLARLTSAMHRCRVSIVHLKTSTGIVDPETCEYIESAGGPLSENVITVSSIDEGVILSAERLRAEIGPVAEEVGYEVFAVAADEDDDRPRILAEYHLGRKTLLQRCAQLAQPRSLPP